MTTLLRFTRIAVFCAVSTVFLLTLPAALLIAQEKETAVDLKRLSKSITAEALSQGSGQPLSGTSGYLAGMVASAAGSMRSTGTDGDPNVQQPAATNIASLLPSVPFALADGSVTGTLSPTGANMQYHGQKTIGIIGFGLGCFRPEIGQSMAGGQLELATMLGNRFAIGSSIALYKNRKDLVINGIWQLPDSGFRFKASGGYLWGNQNFDFPSGEANIDLEQYSYSLATKYILNDTGETGTLQSVGLSVWGAQANQKSNADGPRSFMRETATDFLIMNDPLKLSEGRLFGAAADAQVALLSNLIAKGSLGYERLTFPFSDGTRELNESAYYALDLFYEPTASLTLGAGYRAGAGENRISVTAETGNWQLNAFHNEGQNGIADNDGIMLSYRLLLPAGKQKTPLAQRMQPVRSSDSGNLLADALARPAQLPQSFLAKVDPTAVTLAATISKTGLPSGATVNSNGDVFITVGTGTPTINGITRNGSSYPYAVLVSTTSTQVVIHTRQLPEPSGASDAWVISVADGTSAIWLVNIITNK